MFLRDFSGSVEDNWLPFIGRKEKANYAIE
jgi:hypothetical protein